MYCDIGLCAFPIGIVTVVMFISSCSYAYTYVFITYYIPAWNFPRLDLRGSVCIC